MMVPFTQRGASLVRLGEIAMILELHRQGVSVSAIARQVGLDRKTVHKYIERVLAAVRGLMLYPYSATLPRSGVSGSTRTQAPRRSRLSARARRKRRCKPLSLSSQRDLAAVAVFG